MYNTDQKTIYLLPHSDRRNIPWWTCLRPQSNRTFTWRSDQFCLWRVCGLDALPVGKEQRFSSLPWTLLLSVRPMVSIGGAVHFLGSVFVVVRRDGFGDWVAVMIDWLINGFAGMDVDLYTDREGGYGGSEWVSGETVGYLPILNFDPFVGPYHSTYPYYRVQRTIDPALPLLQLTYRSQLAKSDNYVDREREYPCRTAQPNRQISWCHG